MWKICDSPNCELFGKPQMQINFLNNCTSAINDGRFKWHHNHFVLRTILFYLTSTNEYDVLTDVKGYRSSAVLFNLSILDINVIKDNILYAVELTVCFETNFSKSRNYKINRYKNLSNEVVGNYAVKKLLLEISSPGFYTNDTKPFIKFHRELKIHNTERMLRKCSEVTVKASFYLYICKKKEWLSPKLLTFVQA